MEYARVLAEFCTGISFDDLPGEVINKAKLCVLDCIANVYGSLELEDVSRIVSYVRSLGGPDAATVLGCGFRTGIHHAAFVNGTAAEALEAQDGLRFGGNHPGTAVIPAAFALGETLGSSGKELIEAIVAGYEAAGRIAAAVHPHHTLSGFLPTGTCGCFGAAVAASKLMGHTSSRMLDALGIAGFLVPLSMAEHLMGGFTSKIVQGGQAASAGLTAAGLAGCGITGPSYVLEGSSLGGGFTRITCRNEPNLERILEGLGTRFVMTDIYFKPYTSCRHTHGAAQAALELAARERISPEDIESVDVYTYGIAAMAVGRSLNPNDTFVAAQFSLPYVVAACLVQGDMAPAQLKTDSITNPVILGLCRKIKIISDQELTRRYPEYTSTKVDVRLAGGRVLSSEIDIPLGDPRNPMSPEDVASKVRRFGVTRKPQKLDEVISLALDLDTLGNLGTLASIV